MNRYANEKVYIAGPACFYPRGYDLWEALRRRAIYFGFGVSLPNDNELNLDNTDLRKNADIIFANCADSMNKSTAIVADLEFFRGSEPDGGSIYEIGMAYARGLRCYGYTRDKRAMVHKHQQVTLRNDSVYDQDNRILPYAELPFCPSLIGGCKIVEGSFEDCMKTYMTDLDEEAKQAARGAMAKPNRETIPNTTGKPRIFLSGIERYAADAAEKYAVMKSICEKYGFAAVTPLDILDGSVPIVSDDPYTVATDAFDRWQKNLRSCDLFLANLNDFHGYEPSSDVSFECGSAWQQGKKCYGYMDDISIMQKRIPHYGAEKSNADIYGNIVENFDYPINLMFASSMPVFAGSFEEVVAQVAKDYKKDK
ncbi:MAG: nucleoside 2-deoxyribosyltransferase [Angelakisella sp.]